MVDYVRRNQGHFKEIIGLSLAITVLSVFVNIYYDYKDWKNFANVKKWLLENDLEFTTDAFEDLRLMSLEMVSGIDSYKMREIILTARKSWSHSYDEDFPFDFYMEKLSIRVNKLSKELRFKHWLLNNDLMQYKHVFNDHFVYSLEDAVANIEELTSDTRLYFLLNELGTLHADRDNLKDYPVNYNHRSLLSLLWSGLVKLAKLILLLGFIFLLIGGLGILCIGLAISHLIRGTPWWRRRPATINTNYRTSYTPRTNNSSLFFRFLSALFTNNNNRSSAYGRATTTQQENTSGGWFDRFFGNYFDPSKSVLTWSISDENAIVGDEAVLKAKFFRNNGTLINPNTLENIRVEVIIAQTMVESNIVYDEGEESISIHFTPIKSGSYKLNIFANGSQVKLPSCTKFFKPGEVDPFKSTLVVPSSLLVLETGIEELLTFDERDKYGNKCALNFEDLHKYQFVISNFKTGIRITPSISFNSAEFGDTRNKAYIIINDPGIFQTDIFFNGEFFCKNVLFLVLSKNEMTEVKKNIATTNWNLWYESYLLSNVSNSNPSIDISTNTNNSYDNNAYDNDERQPLVDQTHMPGNLTEKKRKKVYCYISPKFFIVKEFWLKIFPKKLYTFRINPTVKVAMLNEEIKPGVESFTVESSNGQQVKLFCQKRNIIVATFVKLLLKNIGGSECFEDKKRYFYNELKKLHSIKANMRMSLKLKRDTIIEDTWRSVKSLNTSDWWKKFEITFEGELGLDYGGLSREWFHIVLNRLFNEELFQRFDKDNLQGLTHPTQFRKGIFKKLKFYELAGMLVGKCLIECSCDQVRQQYVKARFTRSFLSQILGLGVSWKHFETDDKEYYTGKIKYIIDNDPEYLDIYFTEDVYDNDNQLVKTVELKTNGSRILVNETNKFEYIQRLAEYRLADCVKDEISAFLKGMHSLIPDGLLTMFDENELELLLCGMEIISLADLKANHIPDYNTIFFKDVIGWFWTVVSGFSQEELSRLLQFTTGCSQLPPDGFSGLRPKFKITHSGGSDTLPMAHTCFNQLCLPTYSSMKELKTKLLIAITEGVEGFGIS